MRARTFGYDWEREVWRSGDLTVFADHILSAGVMAFSQRTVPQNEVVCVLKDGTAAVMTYNEMHNVNAWHRMQTPEGKILDVASMKDDAGKGDRFFYVVNRAGVISLEVQQDGNVLLDNAKLENGEWTGIFYASEVVTNFIDSPDTTGMTRHSCLVKAELWRGLEDR